MLGIQFILGVGLFLSVRDDLPIWHWGGVSLWLGDGLSFQQPDVPLWIFFTVSVHTESMGKSLWIPHESGRGKGVVKEPGRVDKPADRPDQ